MIHIFLRRSLALFAATLLLSGVALASHDKALKEAVASPKRSEAFVARDKYRHPLQTLEFFGIKPNMTVVEVWPGQGWYTEILAPYLRTSGKYYAATPAASLPDASDYTKKTVANFQVKLAADPARFDRVIVTEFRPPMRSALAPAGSADLVLTFRNVHNWMASSFEQDAFDAFYAALKPGGVLGVVEHRAAPNTTPEQSQKSGYVNAAYVKALAFNSGFKLVASSEINANPKDRKNYPEGVWTLPPSLELKDQDRAKYLAIGESDRMTLKFVKPTNK